MLHYSPPWIITNVVINLPASVWLALTFSPMACKRSCVFVLCCWHFGQHQAHYFLKKWIRFQLFLFLVSSDTHNCLKGTLMRVSLVMSRDSQPLDPSTLQFLTSVQLGCVLVHILYTPMHYLVIPYFSSDNIVLKLLRSAATSTSFDWARNTSRQMIRQL